MSRYNRNFRRLKESPDNQPSFHAPLTHNLLLTKGQGAATFTRATTATLTDFEGLLKTATSGEVRFEGARRVENLIPSTGAGSASLAVAAAKTMTLAAGDYVFSMGIGTGTATFSGTGGASGTLTASATNRTSILKTCSNRIREHCIYDITTYCILIRIREVFNTVCICSMVRSRKNSITYIFTRILVDLTCYLFNLQIN